MAAVPAQPRFLNPIPKLSPSARITRLPLAILSDSGSRMHRRHLPIYSFPQPSQRNKFQLSSRQAITYVHAANTRTGLVFKPISYNYGTEENDGVAYVPERKMV